MSQTPTSAAKKIQFVDVSKSVTPFPERSIGLFQGQDLVTVLKFMLNNGVWHTVKQVDNWNQTTVKLAPLIISPFRVFEESISSALDQNSKLSAQERRFRFRSSSEKSLAMAFIRDCFSGLKYGSTVLDRALVAADELFTNAIYNAPFPDEGVTLDRTTLVVLDIDRMGELVVFPRPDGIFVGCIDRFGNLKCEETLQHLVRVAESAGKAMNMGRGGAGIGLYQTLRACSECLVITEEQRFTLVGFTFSTERKKRLEYDGPLSISFCSFSRESYQGLQLLIENRKDRTLVSLNGELKGRWNSDPQFEGQEVIMEFGNFSSRSADDLASFKNWLEHLAATKKLTLIHSPARLEGATNISS